MELHAGLGGGLSVAEIVARSRLARGQRFGMRAGGCREGARPACLLHLAEGVCARRQPGDRIRSVRTRRRRRLVRILDAVVVEVSVDDPALKAWLAGVADAITVKVVELGARLGSRLEITEVVVSRGL